MTNYIEDIFGDGGLFASQFAGYEMREGQVALARMVDEAMRSGRHALGEAPCGCHVAGQGILMFDGSVKAVEDIVVGDRLMGPSEPRTVLALARGQQETVQIRPAKGAPWRVNLDHILTLVRIDNDEVVDVRVRDWLGWSVAHKTLHKLFRSRAVFEPQRESLPPNPYLLGAWLGDDNLAVTDCPIVIERDPEARVILVIQGKPMSLPVASEHRFVPMPFKVAPLDERRALLAGLLDAGGSLTGTSYDFTSKSDRLVADVVFLARSVGLAAENQARNEGTRLRVRISGDTHLLPCRIPRKKAPVRAQRKSALRTSFEVVPTGLVEPYFGFSLDGDGRYLLDDFIVTHNSGKSVAYSVPAVWHAHHRSKRVVIATANIALQDQLFRKDLPMLASVLPWPFTFALLKGRNNFICRERLAESQANGELSELFEDGQQSQVDDMLAWAEETTTGDVSELPFIPAPQVWSRFAVGSDECKGEGCAFRERCFSERAKANALDAEIVVTNYHMLFAHIALRKETGQDLVLPAFDLLILDEAHEAAGIAREFFGFSVSEYTFSRLANAAAGFGHKPLATTLRQEAERLFERLGAFARSPRYEKRLKAPGFVDAAALQRALRALVALAGAQAEGEVDPNDRATARNVARLATAAAARLAEAVQQSDPEKVYWLDLDPKGRVKLRSKPINVSNLLEAELFGCCPSVSLISATLTTSGNFDFVRREVGVPEGAIEVIAETPFDFQAQALLVVPERMPDPADPAFIDSAAGIFRQVIEVCDGRTLGLFTSYRNLNAVYERVAGGRHRVLRQGDLPRAELTRIFKEDVGSVLFGTQSFWTGIDVPGEALTGLVIDKLPFPHPDDPVIAAICERDPRAFHNYLIPSAIITLRQGVGRLIRCKTDLGVVVILDKRLAEKRYGRKFLKSLPAMLSTRRIENIARFLEEARYARAG